MQRSDWVWMSGWLSARFEVEVTVEWVLENLPRTRNGSVVGLNEYSDGSWAMWFKNRIYSQKLFDWCGNVQQVGRLTVTLHTGFLSLEETCEHIDRLRTKDDDTIIRHGPSTPGIERREAPLGPINATAARVMSVSILEDQ